MKKSSGKTTINTVTLLFILLTILVQCKKKITIDPLIFSSWFIDSSEKSDPNFNWIDSAGADSLISIIRKNSKHGVFAETLYDTSNTSWVLGCKTPSSIKADSSYPLIIYLHGGTGTKVNTKGIRAFEMLSPLTDSMQVFLASPSSSVNARWWDRTGLSRILQTLRFMTLHYPVDKIRYFWPGSLMGRLDAGRPLM